MSDPGPEEGGEDIFPMPVYCERWECGRAVGIMAIEARKLEPDENGFMCCPICGASYGAASPTALEDGR